MEANFWSGLLCGGQETLPPLSQDEEEYLIERLRVEITLSGVF